MVMATAAEHIADNGSQIHFDIAPAAIFRYICLLYPVHFSSHAAGGRDLYTFCQGGRGGQNQHGGTAGNLSKLRFRGGEAAGAYYSAEALLQQRQYPGYAPGRYGPGAGGNRPLRTFGGNTCLTVRSQQDHPVSLLCFRYLRNIHHKLIHTDSAQNRRRLAADQHVPLSRQTPCQNHLEGK